MEQATIKIEKNVPMPKAWVRHGGLTDAIRQLDVGDSFVIPKKSRSMVTATANRVGIKATVRNISETEVRVWRTA